MELEFDSNVISNDINVYVKGEHNSKTHYVVDKNMNLNNFLAKIQLNNQSNFEKIKLFRMDIKKEQREMIDNHIKSLKRTLFQVKSSTLEEEQIRTSEASRIKQFIEEVSMLEPEGQMIVKSPDLYRYISLKEGDVIEIPSNNNLVSVYGEVMFPNTFVIPGKIQVKELVSMAGGFNVNADTQQLFIMRSNGMVEGKVSDGTLVFPGDRLMVLQKIDTKTFQMFQDITKVLYQIALSTGVFLKL
jgi:protein involved in polysaccharide export with SLBB domain